VDGLVIALKSIEDKGAKDFIGVFSAIKECTDVPTATEARTREADTIGTLFHHTTRFSIGRPDVIWLLLRSIRTPSTGSEASRVNDAS
jgi:hypothetical protein